MSEQEWFTKDFYRELGVDKDADDATIKKAYRKLARKYHPDQNPGNAAAEAKFKDISEAYTVLSDKQQRQKYDAIRQMAGGGARFAPGGNAGFEDLFGGMFGGGSTTFNMNGQQFGGGFSSGGVEDLLGGLFGGAQFAGTQFGARGTHAGFGSPGAFGGAAGFGSAQPEPVRGKDLKSQVKLSFRQALKGTEIRLKVGGKSLTARIPAGVKDGQKIKLPGKGKAGQYGGKAGDLVITVSVASHPLYTREGNDLLIRVPVTVREAVEGGTVEVPLLDGSTARVSVPAGSSSGSIIRQPGLGVTTAKVTGDLLVELQVSVPADLSDEARQALEAFAAASADFDPRAALADLADQ